VKTWASTSYLADGFYSINSRVVDAVGNIGAASATQNFSIDSTSNQLIGNASANTLTATGAKDLITGLGGADTFRLASLTQSTLANFDRITDFIIGTDILDGPTAVSAANINKLGSVAALDAQSISILLTSSYFAANKAATFSYADPSGTLRSFLALNNGVAGFSASTDAIVEITGYIGSLNNLQIF
jgi:serralysin